VANGNAIDDIRRQMAQIRRELHEDIQGVVAGAEAVTDWRRYVRLYPWPSVAAAFVVGYLIVPKRRKSVAEVVQEVVPATQKVVEIPTVRKKQEKRGSLIGKLFGLLMPIGVKAAQSYATSFLESWIAQQGMAGVIPGMPGGPGGPTGSGGPAAGPKSPGQPRPNPGPSPGPR